MKAYHRLSRRPMLRRNNSSRAEDIANSSERVNHRLVLVHFAAQAMDKDVHDVSLGVKAVVEDVLQDHRLGDGAVRVAHKVFEQGKFARLQLELLAATLDLAGEQIH